MRITLDEFKTRLTPAPEDLEEVIHSLRGILPPTVTVEEAREERIAKHERHL